MELRSVDWRWIAWTAFWLLPAALQAQPAGDADSLLAVKQTARDHGSAFQFLRELSDGIGPRVTGSPQEKRAGDWALETMRAVGLQRVHAEPWQLEKGWRRHYALCRMVSPFPLELIASSYGWAGSTPVHGMEGDVVLVDRNDLAGEAQRNAGRWAGKVLLVVPSEEQRDSSLKSLTELPEFLAAAVKGRAIAVIYRDQRPGLALTHTGPLGFPARSTPVAVIDIAKEQESLLTRLLRAGTKVRLAVDISNEFTAGPVTSHNVVGEIPGAEHPEEVVVVGAHLDSWDLGTGAIDDGFGVAASLGAAKSIVAAGIKPRRTIRFVLFTGEEQGLLGSRAYVRAHEAEMKDHVCALILDWGNGPITKVPVAGHDEFKAPLKDLLARIGDGAPIDVSDGYLTYTDAFAFTMAGVAGIAPLQDSANYSLVGHSAADTLDKVSAAVLEKDTAVLALLAVGIANSPERLGGRWSARKTAQMLEDQRGLLSALGLWPF